MPRKAGSHLFVENLVGALVKRLDERGEHFEAAGLHGQTALGLGLKHRQVVVQLRVLLRQRHVICHVACNKTCTHSIAW